MARLQTDKHNGPRKLLTRAADNEIKHLETVLSLSSRSYATTSLPRLDFAYWRSRVDHLSDRYDLLPQQKDRVGKLSRSLAAAAAEEHAPAAADPLSRVAA